MNLAKYDPYLRAGLSILSERLRRRIFPWFVHFHVTGRCNLQCPYCYARYAKDEASMPELDTITGYIDQLAAMGTRYLAIQGGEPLLRKDLDRVVDYALNKKMIVAVVTNGIYLDRHIETLKRVHNLKISLDGIREHNDAVRGAGTYDKVMDNLALARRRGLTRFSFDTTISTSTKESFEHIVEHAATLGTTVFLAEILPKLDERLDVADLTQEERRRIWLRAKAMKKEGYPVENPWEAIENMLTHGEHIGPFDVYYEGDTVPGPLRDLFDSHSCPYGKYGVVLDCNGVFYPCARYWKLRSYDTKALSFDRAYRMMSADDSCRLCRSILNCQLGQVFSTSSFKTLIQLSKVGLRYSY